MKNLKKNYQQPKFIQWYDINMKQCKKRQKLLIIYIYMYNVIFHTMKIICHIRKIDNHLKSIITENSILDNFGSFAIMQQKLKMTLQLFL